MHTKGHNTIFLTILFISIGFLLVTSCKKEKRIFNLVRPADSGLDFNNRIPENDTFNIFIHEYINNGGGIGVGDFNRDGLKDLFFAGNLEPNHLYLNKGKLKFEDVSETAGITMNNAWSSGVTVADINNDGWDDVYVSATFWEDPARRRNRLFINQGLDSKGKPYFKDEAAAYGIADNSHSTHAVFLDYDLDGDLDLYVLNNKMLLKRTQSMEDRVMDGSSENNDHFYRNEGNGTYTEIGRDIGILYEGFGLGVAVLDFNRDGYPDIYVSNDFITNDVFYVNNGDGTFTNRIHDLMKHQSFASMGSDVADFNDDGYVDIFTLDMLPTTNYRTKQMYIGTNIHVDELYERKNYEPQYMRNTMQVNNAGTSFSDISQVAGLDATDWSWSVLFTDLDNDGLKDVAFTNGFMRDITDHDFSHFRSRIEASFLDTLEILSYCPSFKTSNYMYRSLGDYKYNDVTHEWGIQRPSYSNGAAFVDLDNDGDLEYITNNINDPAFLYENLSNKKYREHHWIKFELNGPANNRDGFGTKIEVFYHGRSIYYEHHPNRGYISTVDKTIHFGLGKTLQLDSVWVQWPTGESQVLYDIVSNQTLSLDFNHAKPDRYKRKTNDKTIFSRIDDSTSFAFVHQDKKFQDFLIQITMPERMSQEGPGIAVGDINGDNKEDFVVGNGRFSSTECYIQSDSGTFNQHPLMDTLDREDMGLLLFDADQDGDKDLYISSGSYEMKANSDLLNDRLYLNDGMGNFKYDKDALPENFVAGSAVIAADIDSDGDLDLFVGGRILPQAYPLPVKSTILINEGGTFKDATRDWCPELMQAGMVTAALWSDYDNDNKIDLIIAGDWMPVRIFRNSGDRLEEVTSGIGLENTQGWWNSVAAADFDRDGDMDYVAGNQGLNMKYKPLPGKPVKIFAKDFDNNGLTDNVITAWREGEYYPVHLRNDLSRQLNYFRERYQEFSEYSARTFDELFSTEDLTDAYQAEAKVFESIYIENLGNGQFKWRVLPMETQFAPVYGMLADDFTGDGNPDVLMVGNNFAFELFTGKQDAFIGLLLQGNGDGHFQPVRVDESGFFVNGDAKGMASLVRQDGSMIILVGQNNDQMAVFGHQINQGKRTVDPEYDEYRVRYESADGKHWIKDIGYGSSFLSASSRRFVLPVNVTRATLFSYTGETREILP